MNENEIVLILLEYIKELGYKVKIIPSGVPTVSYVKKEVRLTREDVILYHVLHEVAHMLLGDYENTPEAEALNEALAESTSIVVRNVLGFEKHPHDDLYIDLNLRRLGKSRKQFFNEYGALIKRNAKVILKRIKQTNGKGVPFVGCKRVLTAGRTY